MTFARKTVCLLLLLGQHCWLTQDVLAAGADHRHHIALVGGFAENDSKSAKFTGVEYEYRIADRWGIGGYYEFTFDGFDLEAIGLIGTYRPSGAWKIMGGGGVERKLGTNKDKRLLRLGVGYDFHVGDSSLTPVLAVDWVEDNSYVLYLGVAIGFGF